ncbi:EIF-2-alpha kinase GCN2 isoform X1, partial [Tanacetum coccineum]
PALLQDDCDLVSENQIKIKLRPHSEDPSYEDVDVSALLSIRFFDGYPYKCPKLQIKLEKGLAKSDADNLLKHLIDSYAAEGRVMILKLVEAARKFLSEVAPHVSSTGSEKEDLNVTKDNFRALMGIVPMDSIDPNSANNIDERLKGKFCTLIGNRIFKDISMKKVKTVLKNENEETDDIKRAYALLKQDWAALALSSILKGKYNKEKEKNTKFIGGCVFFLQCCLMRKYDEGFNLFDINKEKIKNFQLKYEDDYGRLSASIGYSEFRGNKIIRKIGEVRNIIKNRRKPLTMNSLLVIDEAVAKFLSEAASLVSKESAATEEGTDAG